MKTDKQFYKDTFGWGFLLWLTGYILGIILFMLMPPATIGWVITPFASLFTLWVLIKRIKSSSLQYYLIIGVIWTILAVVLDYLLIVKAFKPADGYYKFDVYLYYTLTFILPVIVGLWKQNKIARGKIV